MTGGNTGGVPVDLILFGLVAVFLILRLRSVLGKRVGADRPPAGDVRGRTPETIEGRAEPVPSARPLPDPASPVGRKLAGFRDLERGFDPTLFLRNAEASFRRIVEAFAAGDRNVLRSLLTDGAYNVFEGAIRAREAAGQTQRSEIRVIQQATIESAEVLPGGPGGGRRGLIEVRFVSDQISLLSGSDGAPLTGTDAVTELVDRWLFERLYPGEAAWRLAESRPV